LSHDGPARQLVHRLKYEGIVVAADVLAETMLPLFEYATALVPIPRTIVRRHRYGIDPGMALADAISRRSGIPTLRSLRPALLGRKHAGVVKEARVRPRYSLVGQVPSGALLIDDVVTTGITISAAAAITGLSTAVTATSRVLSTAAIP
jgi:predicted amidophosphoribosyltransferase